MAETAESHLLKPDQLNWLGQLDADFENLRAALEWALSKDSPELALRLCAALGTFWRIRRYWLEGSKWLRSALSKPSRNPDAAEKIFYIGALYQDAGLADGLDDINRMKTSAELSLSLAAEGVDNRDIAIARFYVGFALYRQNKIDAARSLIEQSLGEFGEMNDSYWEAYAFRRLGYLLEAQGKFKSDAWFFQALELARKAGERLNLAGVLWEYSNLLYLSNRVDESMTYVEEADMLYKQIG